MHPFGSCCECCLLKAHSCTLLRRDFSVGRGELPCLGDQRTFLWGGALPEGNDWLKLRHQSLTIVLGGRNSSPIELPRGSRVNLLLPPHGCFSSLYLSSLLHQDLFWEHSHLLQITSTRISASYTASMNLIWNHPHQLLWKSNRGLDIYCNIDIRSCSFFGLGCYLSLELFLGNGTSSSHLNDWIEKQVKWFIYNTCLTFLLPVITPPSFFPFFFPLFLPFPFPSFLLSSLPPSFPSSVPPFSGLLQKDLRYLN